MVTSGVMVVSKRKKLNSIHTLTINARFKLHKGDVVVAMTEQLLV